MAHNLGTRAVLADKLSSATSGMLSKVKLLGKADGALAAPVAYKVVHPLGIYIRSGCEVSAEKLHMLEKGDKVMVVELVGNRARCIHPVEGWVFVETRQGTKIMKRCLWQNKESQHQALEQCFEQRRFNQLKNQKAPADCRNVNLDIAGPRHVSKGGDDGVSSDEESDDDDQGGDSPSRRRRSGRESASDTAGETVVPRLSAPPPGCSARTSPANSIASSPAGSPQRLQTPAGTSTDILGFDCLGPDERERKLGQGFIEFNPSAAAQSQGPLSTHLAAQATQPSQQQVFQQQQTNFPRMAGTSTSDPFQQFASFPTVGFP